MENLFSKYPVLIILSFLIIFGTIGSGISHLFKVKAIKKILTDEQFKTIYGHRTILGRIFDTALKDLKDLVAFSVISLYLLFLITNQSTGAIFDDVFKVAFGVILGEKIPSISKSQEIK